MKMRLGTLLAVVVVVGIIIGVGRCFFVANSSDGHRDGYIQKFSRKHGWVYTSWEGELAVPGFGGSQGGKYGQSDSGNVWEFFVTDPKIIDEINEVDASMFVRVHYHESRWVWGHWSQYEVMRVEIRKGKPTVPQAKEK